MTLIKTSVCVSGTGSINDVDGKKLCVQPMPVQMHLHPGVNKSPKKFIFAYLVFSQKPYLNVWCFEKIHICIPKIQNLHTKPIFRHAFDFFMT